MQRAASRASGRGTRAVRGAALFLQGFGALPLIDLQVVVGRVELGAETAPGAALDREIDRTQLVRRQAQRDYMADPHDDVVGHDLDAFGREILAKPGLVEMGIDLVHGLALIVAQDHGHQHGWRRCLRCGRSAQAKGKREDYDQTYWVHVVLRYSS